MTEFLIKTYHFTRKPLEQLARGFRRELKKNTLTSRVEYADAQTIDELTHALQTPLTVLRTAFELLQKRTRSCDRKLYDIMNTSIIDVSDLTRNLLCHARIGSVQIHSYELFSLTELLKSCGAMYSIVAEAEAIKINLSIQNDVHVVGDRSKIKESIENILHNACKYSGDSHVIFVRLQSVGTLARLEIEDMGLGISPEKLPYVFDRFSCSMQSKNSESGCGLGLAIAKHIVTLHKGTIAIRSSLGSGSIVTIELPCATNVS